MMVALRLLLLFISLHLVLADGNVAYFQGRCPHIPLHKKLDFAKFSGTWYIAASLPTNRSAIATDCIALDFQEDNLGFTLQQTYATEHQGNRSRKELFARADPTFDAGDYAKFVISYNENDQVVQFPFNIVTTDYTGLAVAFTCKTTVTKPPAHHLFAWVLTRSKAKLTEDQVEMIGGALALDPELEQLKDSFQYRNLSEEACSFQNTTLAEDTNSGTILMM